MKDENPITKEPLVYLILLNWNGMEHLPVCLASLKRQTYGNLRVLMVDNGSTDGSIEFAQGFLPDIETLCNKKNIGFAKANNQGMYYAADKGAKYAILLNNDTECEPDFVSELVKSAESDSSIAACAPKILYYQARDILNGIGTKVTLFGFGSDRGFCERDEGQYDEECDVFGMSGGAMLIRTDVIKELGGFDPAYFIYFEDIDLAWRIRAWGYRIVAVPKAVVYHKFSATMGKAELRKEFLCEKNRIRGILKNFEPSSLARIIPAMLSSDSHRIMHYWFEKSDRCSIKRGLLLLWAYLWNVLHFPSLMRQRARAWKGRKMRDTQLMKFLTPVMGSPPISVPRYHWVNCELFSKIANKPREIIMGRSDGHSLGVGWEDLYTHNNDKARRTSKKAYFYLPGGESHGASLIFEFAGTPFTMISGTIKVNGRNIGEFLVGASGEETIRFAIPHDVAACPILEGCIVNDVMWRPNDFCSNRDYRSLGISVKSIALHATGQ
jgi:GT2 family glycosyltransferase